MAMIELFFSYSHKDEELRNELETHLALLKRQNIISAWHDRRITAGSTIHSEISRELESSQIILLLVSANFLASDYCYEKEMTRALERHAEKSAIVIPVILHPCDWHSAPFGSLLATPTDGKPVSKFANQHEAFAIIAKDVRAAAEKIGAHRVPSLASAKASVHMELALPGPRSSNLRIKRKFDDHERDEFLEDSYEYIARFFDGSLQELEQRNPQIKSRFKRLDGTSFQASIYDNGNRVAQCSIWYGNGSHFSGAGISYSSSADAPRNSFNESLTVVDDGFMLQLKPFGMFHGYNSSKDQILTQQGAAEYFWSMLIRPLQA